MEKDQIAAAGAEGLLGPESVLLMPLCHHCFNSSFAEQAKRACCGAKTAALPALRHGKCTNEIIMTPFVPRVFIWPGNLMAPLIPYRGRLCCGN